MIGSKVGGIPEILRYQELMFEPGDAHAIADAVQRLYEDGDAYARAKRLCAERRAAFEFDWIAAYERAMLEA